MRAVVCPPIALAGIVAGLVSTSAARAAAQGTSSMTVALDRAGIERLLALDHPPAVLAVVGTERLTTVASDAEAVRLGLDEYLAARLPGSAESATREGDRVRLPIRYARLATTGQAGLRLVPAIELEGGGLRYTAERRAYEGALLIGLQDVVQPDVRRALTPPIRLRLSVDAGTATPSVVELEHTNIPFTRVVVRSRMPADSVALRVLPEFDAGAVAVRLPVRPPAVSLAPSSRRILGFGLETARITLKGPLGGPVGGASVTVAVDRGSAEPSSLVLGHDGVAVVRLRSRGLGPATLTVSGPSVLGGSTVIEFVWPATLVLAALLGAALGVGWTAARARRARSRTALAKLGGDLVLGTAAGAVSATTLVAATNVLPIDVPIRLAEAIVLLVGALGAGYGPHALARVRARQEAIAAGARH